MSKRTKYAIYAVLGYLVFVPNAESQPPNITAAPPNPLRVVKGKSVSLQWTYDFGGSAFSRVEFTRTVNHATIVVVDSSTAFVRSEYRSRLKVNATETNTTITFGPITKADSNTYAFKVENKLYESDSDVVEIIVQYSSTAAPSEPAKVNKDVIYGVSIAVLAVMLISFIIYFIKKHLRRQRLIIPKQTPEDIQRSHFNEGIETEENDADNANVPGPSYSMELRKVADSQERPEGAEDTETTSCLKINEYALLNPATRSWEVPRNKVITGKVIGQGSFGEVVQGKVSELQGREGTTKVAIKRLKAEAQETEKKDLISELEVMKTLKPHRQVITLLGCVTESDPILVIIEYVPYGDLLGYLRKSRGLNDTYYNVPDVKPKTRLTSLQLMKFSWQVADGMSYLSSRNIIHRDLAARNVLVGEGETCKVTDFGMAKDVQQKNVYKRTTMLTRPIPIKWTAIEAIKDGTYSTKSDVWSFGVVLYEIFTIGGSPYPRTVNKKMIELLERGYRMPKPNHLDDALYKIMSNCWKEHPDDRPTFESLRGELKRMENQHKRLINMKDYDKKLYENVEDLMF